MRCFRLFSVGISGRSLIPHQYAQYSVTTQQMENVRHNMLFLALTKFDHNLLCTELEASVLTQTETTIMQQTFPRFIRYHTLRSKRMKPPTYFWHEWIQNATCDGLFRKEIMEFDKLCLLFKYTQDFAYLPHPTPSAYGLDSLGKGKPEMFSSVWWWSSPCRSCPRFVFQSLAHSVWHQTKRRGLAGSDEHRPVHDGGLRNL